MLPSPAGCKFQARTCPPTQAQALRSDHQRPQDAFGNYVVQYVLELGHPKAAAAIMRQLSGQYAELSQQKFSSNVVEKCLKLGSPSLAEQREAIVRELLISTQLSRMLQVCARCFPPCLFCSS